MYLTVKETYPQTNICQAKFSREKKKHRPGNEAIRVVQPMQFLRPMDST